MSCHNCSGQCASKSSSNWLKLPFKKAAGSSHVLATTAEIALVGMPNVGKSVLFNALTGMYVTVSNYPGTTVEVARGKAVINDQTVAVIDTPGMYSLLPITEEEKVARDLLMQESVNLAIHVVEAKNLGRMLTLTFQLMEAGLPLILAVNMIDEAQRLNIHIDTATLAEKIGIPVVKISAAQGWGINQLKGKIADYVH